MKTALWIAMVSLLLLFSARAFAQSAEPGEEKEAAVLELGAAAGRSLTAGESSFGPNLAVEVTPIENWLELEAGVTPFFRAHSTEWDTDLLFKKPWKLSPTVEFMAGAGPERIHSTGGGRTDDSVGAEAILDFMFWTTPKHRIGWYLEPGYDYNFGPGREQSIGISGGLLIAIP